MSDKDLGAQPDPERLAAAPARKLWRAPQFMVSKVEDTATGGAVNTDGATSTGVQS